MLKRIAALAGAVLAACIMIGCSDASKKTNAAENGKTEANVPVTEEKTGIKNVIFLIPDGAGYPLYDFANDVKVAGGFNSAKYPNKTPTDNTPMTMRSYLAGSMTTLNVNGAITDSAAAGTAMSTGLKTVNGYVGLDPNMRPRANILEAAQSLGKASGLVATYEWMHATPASFSAHAENRSDYKKLYEQIENQGIEVVLGSGYGAVSKYATIQNAVDRGYTVLNDKAQLSAVKPGDKIWGDFSNPSHPYDINLADNQPTLAEMTKAAITALSGDEDGFFLMVEGSKVDTGGHANDAVVSTSEYLAFDAAFKVAVEFAKSRTDTVVLAAPDHDTGAMKYDEITNLETMVLSVCNGLDPVSIEWGTTGHSEQQVGVWTYVPEGTDVIEGLNKTLGDTKETRSNYVIDNTQLAPYIASLFGVNLDTLTEELFFDVTDIGRYSTAVGKFSFNNGDKYLYVNDSHYYKDGKEVDMDGKVAIEINGRIYVPREIVDDEDLKYVSEPGSDEVKGSGSEIDPYIIDDAWDFVEFAGNILLGETYEGVHFLQTEDIDLSDSSDFVGAGQSQIFAGVYNGGGHTIKFDLAADKDQTLFPKVTGTVMNLSVTGKVKSEGAVNWAYTGGIARLIDKDARLVNCTSNVEVTGLNVGGLVGGNSGYIENCYFGGTVKGENKTFALAGNAYGGTFVNCYYLDSCGAEQTEEGNTKISKADLEATAQSMNDNRAAAAETLGVDVGGLGYFKVSDDGETIVLYIPAPVVKSVTVTPSAVTVNKGDAAALTAVVEGEYNPSQKVVWSIESTEPVTASKIYEDGFLQISADETSNGFTVLAKSAIDGSVVGSCSVTVGADVVTQPDGSRARPYLITNESEFLEFTNAVIAGKNMNGLYFRQTNDLDMTTVAEYNGMPNAGSFYGVYDGAGHTINVNIESDADNSLFGSCYGIVMNVGTTGTVKGATRPSGISRAVRDKGIVVNCFSLCDIISDTEASGIVRSNYNTVANCFFGGTLLGTSKYNICYVQPEGTAYNNAVKSDEDYTNGNETGVTDGQTAAQLLNSGRTRAAELCGLPESMLCEWSFDEKLSPVLS